jgi:tetratricopeptide (TPR) repeat protein
MLQRLHGVSGHGRNPSVRWGRLILNLLWLLAIFVLFVLGAFMHPSTPLRINQAFSYGVQYVTSNHLTPGPVIQWAIVALALVSMRWVYLELRAFLGGSIEVRPVDNTSGSKVDTHPLDAAFREYLTLPKLYQLTAIPGDPEPDHLVEVLRVPSAAGWRGLLAAALAYTFPRRAFIVSASLRKQAHKPMYGAAVQVRRLPGLATELETQWSTSYERALQRGAYAAVAHILPQTKACRNVPWSAWRQRVLPASLFRDYQRAKKMVAERRYDEALNLYHQALIKDANNIDMRYDVGQLYERLGLYPDALYTYLNLVDQLFPYKPRARRARTRRPGMGKRDPFVIWYRYVVVLALGAPLARELLYPDWKALRSWLAQASQQHAGGLGEERPLRTLDG